MKRLLITLSSLALVGALVVALVPNRELHGATNNNNSPIIKLYNQGSILATVAAGILNINASTNMVGAWNSTTHTYTLTSSGGGSGILVVTTGAGAPSAACAIPSGSNLAMYFDTTGLDMWFCAAVTPTWKKMLSTTNVGGFVATGATGTAPANPSAGNVTCYYSSVSNTQICLDSSGNAYSTVKTAGSRTANQFGTYVAATGILQTAAIASADLPATSLIRTFSVITGDPGASSTALANDNDSPVAISNQTGADLTVLGVACYADAGSPTVTPILTGGTSTSIVSGAITCGTAAWAAGTLSGTPVIHSFSNNGATCTSTPCSVDVNITAAGGTAKYLVVKLITTL